MKTFAKVLCSLIVLLAVISIQPQMSVFAAGQDGITLSVETDKESYESGQEIGVTASRQFPLLCIRSGDRIRFNNDLPVSCLQVT